MTSNKSIGSQPIRAGTPGRRSFAIAFACLCALLIATVAASWPENVFTTPATKGVRFNLQVLVPQGWAFFTRSPEESTVVPYVRSKYGEWVRAGTLPQANAVNLFGISRNQRSQGTELAILASEVPGFATCDDYLGRCLAKPIDQPVKIINSTNTREFCGTVRFVQQEPVKYAYRDRVPEMVRARAYVDLEISCFAH